MRDTFTKWREGLLESGTVAPLALSDSQEEVRAMFGEPDSTSAQKKKGRALIFRYADIEFHFDPKRGHRLSLIYSEREDGSPRISIQAA